MEVDVHFGDPLDRLIAEQQGGEEGDERIPALAVDEIAVAAVENDRGDGDSTQEFHGRAGAGRDDGFLVGKSFAVVDGSGEAVAHRGFQIVGLDEFAAEDRLLDGRNDAGEVLILGSGKLADALDDRAQHQGDRSQNEERRAGQAPVEGEHGDQQREGGEDILHPRHEQLHHTAGGGGRVGNPGDQVARREMHEKRQRLVEEMVGNPALLAGDDVVANPGENDRGAVFGESFHQENEDDADGDAEDLDQTGLK